MKWIILLTILFTFSISTSYAQNSKSISKPNDCSLSNVVKVDITSQRDVENNTHNYWATREVDFRVTNISKCPIFIRLFETFGSSDFLPAGISFRFDEKLKQWSNDFWGNNIPKFESLELAGFDNHRLSLNQSFTFTDLMEAVPFESHKTIPFKIKYKRIIYISLDKSETEVKAVESPVFVVTNLK